jgi:type II secretory pathway pseudopilin PulG
MKTLYRFRTSRGRRAAGFTLVELLVAEAIFLILLVVVVQLIFGLIQTSATQKKRMDSLDDARQALDRLSLDWAARVRRQDVGGLFTKNTGNDQIAFPAQVQSYGNPTRHLAWVTYGVSPVSQVVAGSQSSLTSALVRGTQGYDYTETTFPLFLLPATTNTSTSPNTSAAPSSLANLTTEPLANTVFRFEYCFLVQVPSGSAPGTSYSVNPSIDLTSTNLVGVVVAVAALDPESRQIVTQAQLNALANALPDTTTATNQDPQSLWVSTINSGAFATQASAAGVPLPAINAVRIFQRILYVEE